MKNIIFLIFLLFIFNSCSDELITIVDEYNPPYEIKAIPGDNSISINFWSGVLANDFAGFNLYISSTSAFTDALPNAFTGVGLPTYPTETHTRSNFTLTYPTSAGIQNNDATTGNPNLYYVTVTAYGTNDLADNQRIETKLGSGIPVAPREQNNNGTVTTANITAGNFNATINNNTITATGYQVKSYGYQTNFNSITVFTNNATSSSAPYNVGWLYIFSNGTSLTKVWITSDSACTYATHSRANDCNTI